MHIYNFLETRRSTKLKNMTPPAPTGQELSEILEVAARVPDHGKLNPWYFIVFEGDNRMAFGAELARIWHAKHPDATPTQLLNEEERLTRAPLVVAVVSRTRESTIPVWEQLLSAGACCYNLCLAANAKGYGTNWLSEWFCFDNDVRTLLGLEDGRDNIAGFIYIGKETERSEERPRPDMAEIVNHWTPETTPLNKGDIYNKDGVGFTFKGFSINTQK